MLKPETATHPTSIVIFGGTGDLASTKLFPALFDLYSANQLPKHVNVIGLSRKSLTDDHYRAFVKGSIVSKGHDHDESTIDGFCGNVSYESGSFEDSATYEEIKQRLLGYDKSIGSCANKLFYLAVPPQYYEAIFERLASSQAMALCDNKDSWARLLVEKPFGRDLDTAQHLEQKLCSQFEEDQIYRIDHYLAKDAIENILALRFANTLLADAWDGREIESIQITMLETRDVSNRGAFYDNIGTLRDVGQNHLLQIFALLTMPTVAADAQAVRVARAEALSNLKSAEVNLLVRGQYEGYVDSDGVAQNSDTETYFKLAFTIAGGSWQDVDFTLEAGKALDKKINEAVITFRPQTVVIAEADSTQYRNVLRIQFSPEQHICLSMWTKQPGFAFALREQELRLVTSSGEDCASPEAYERVLFDCIVGDQTRFVSGEEVELAWQFITPLLSRFKDMPLQTYVSGSVGPTGN